MSVKPPEQSQPGCVVKESSLSKTLINRRQEGRDLLILPNWFVDGSLASSTSCISETELKTSSPCQVTGNSLSRPLAVARRRRGRSELLSVGGGGAEIKEYSSLISADARVVQAGEERERFELKKAKLGKVRFSYVSLWICY